MNKRIIKALLGTAALVAVLVWISRNEDMMILAISIGVIAIALVAVKLLNKATQK